MTTKYAVVKDTFEYNPSKFSNIEDAYFATFQQNGVTVALCDSEAEALAAAAQILVGVEKFSYKLASATVVFVEEAEYDQNEDGEWEFVSGSNVCAFRCVR